MKLAPAWLWLALLLGALLLSACSNDRPASVARVPTPTAIRSEQDDAPASEEVSDDSDDDEESDTQEPEGTIEGPLTLAAPVALQDELRQASAAAFPSQQVEVVPLDQPAAVSYTLAPPGDDEEEDDLAGRLVSVPWVLVAHISHEVEDVSWQGLRSGWAEGMAGWEGLTGEARPLTVIIPQGASDLITQALGAASRSPGLSVLEVAPDQVTTAVAADPNALGIVSLAKADFRAKSLAIDGVDLARATGDVGSYPFRTKLAVEAAEGDDELEEQVAASLGPQLEAPGGVPVRMGMIGDLVPARCVYAQHLAYKDMAHSWREVAGVTASFDYTIGSLETALSDLGEALTCTPTFFLIAPKATIEGLHLGGVDMVAIANNHIMDGGAAFFLDFLANMDAAGIAYAGAGPNIAAARAPHIAEVNGTSFAFLSYDNVAAHVYGAGVDNPGTAPIDLETLDDDIAAAKTQADVVVVMFSWGFPEYYADPLDSQKEVAAAALAAGADFVYGDGPHVPQGLGLTGNAPVIYSMGNFIFDQDWCYYTQVGFLTEVVFRGNRVSTMHLHPYQIVERHQPRFVPPDEIRDAMDLIYDSTERLRSGSAEFQRVVCEG
jgi:poly-gamma-glutamate synthesis protein (capsule biosynthesis protein)